MNMRTAGISSAPTILPPDNYFADDGNGMAFTIPQSQSGYYGLKVLYEPPPGPRFNARNARFCITAFAHLSQQCAQSAVTASRSQPALRRSRIWRTAAASPGADSDLVGSGGREDGCGLLAR
jgi:hypothetical protein